MAALPVKPFFIKALAAFSLAPVLTAQTLATQGLSLADRFNNAIEAVQEGIDIIWPGDLDSEDINARFGVGFGWVPDYVGSDDYRFRALPIIDIRYKEVWRLNGSKFTYSIFRRKNFEAGPLLNLHFGRDETDNPALAGLGDINTTLDVGLFARYKTPNMLIATDLRQALGEGQGLNIRLTAGHGIYRNGNFAAGAGVRAKWLSRRATQTNFGITAEQAAGSEAGYGVFEAGAGLSEVSANLIGAYRLREDVRILGLVSTGKLFGSAARSPLVENGVGSTLQVIAGVGLTLQF